MNAAFEAAAGGPAKLLSSVTVALDAREVLGRTFAPLFRPPDVINFGLLAVVYVYGFAYGDGPHAWHWLLATVGLFAAVVAAAVFSARRRARRCPSATFEVWSNALTERRGPGWEETVYWDEVDGHTRVRGHLVLHVRGKPPFAMPANVPEDTADQILDALSRAEVPPKAPVRTAAGVSFGSVVVWVGLALFVLVSMWAFDH